MSPGVGRPHTLLPPVYTPLQVDCLRYAPDMVSGSFGQCTCGAKRADHSEGALAHGTGGAAAREAKAYGKTKQVLRACYTRTSYK